MNVTLGTLRCVLVMVVHVYNSRVLGRARLLIAGTQGPLLMELPPAQALQRLSHQQLSALV